MLSENILLRDIPSAVKPWLEPQTAISLSNANVENHMSHSLRPERMKEEGERSWEIWKDEALERRKRRCRKLLVLAIHLAKYVLDVLLADFESFILYFHHKEKRSLTIVCFRASSSTDRLVCQVFWCSTCLMYIKVRVFLY